jgi:hypothetical protein
MTETDLRTTKAPGRLALDANERPYTALPETQNRRV